MLNSAIVKDLARSLGADLCGIAPPERMDDAPEGFRPRDVMPDCESIISFACRFPVGTLLCRTPVPYTRVRNSITPKMDALALALCTELERRGAACAPIPTNESVYDARTGRYRSILSQKHAAQAAGLGRIGRHTLLMTPQYGCMVWLGCILTTAKLEPDELCDPLCNNCGLCVEVCPVHALEHVEINQPACWEHAFGNDPELKSWVISCHRCRDVCPYLLGSENRALLDGCTVVGLEDWAEQG